MQKMRIPCRRMRAIVILGVVLLQASANITTSDDVAVDFLVLAPYPDIAANPGWEGGPALIPAVRLAVDRINNRTDILPGYKILLLEGDSGCQNEPKAAYSFVSNIFHDITTKSAHVVGVIGPGCSEAALLLGSLGARDTVSIIQVSPSAASPLLTDTEKYPNTFRTLSTALQYINAVIELMAANRWERVAVLHDVTRVYFRYTAEYFLDIYSSKIGFHSEVDPKYYPLGSIEARFKVIILLTGSQLAREVICLAYHRKPRLIYPVYQWVIIGKTKFQFSTNVHFTYSGKFYNCSQEMMKKAIEGSIFTSYRILSREDSLESTDVDLTLSHFRDLYRLYLEQHLKELAELQMSYEADAEEFAVSYYDATWALTLAINASLDQLSKEPSVSLAGYKHGHPQTTSIIRQHLSQLQFEGLMGKIAFRNSTHDSSTPIDIFQCLSGENRLIAIYKGSELDIFPDKAKFVLDTFYQRVVRVHPAATTTAILLALILTIYTLGLHIIFIIFRNHKSVKAASFTISHFMFSGCYLILIRAFLIVLAFSAGWQTKNVEESHTRDVVLGVLCNVNEWLNSIGISLVMGTLCVKLWRLYRLFKPFNTQKRYLVSDVTLTTFVVSLVIVNTILLALWATFDPLLAVYQQQDIEYNGEDEPIILVRVFCRCEYFSVWLSLVFSVNLLVVVCVVILSVLNRRVDRKYFKTAKSVNLMVYLIALSCIMGIGLALVFESLNIHYPYVLWQFSLLSIVTLVCVFMFSPPAFTAIKKTSC